jgi:DNA-binding transcriptional MerR regulator
MLSVGEFSDRFGVPITTLRYYDRIGLLSPQRRPNNHRAYPVEAADKLRLIQLGQALGFTLDEVALLLSADGGARRRELAVKRLAEIDQRRAQLAAAHAVLSHFAVCQHTRASAQECRDTVALALHSTRAGA